MNNVSSVKNTDPLLCVITNNWGDAILEIERLYKKGYTLSDQIVPTCGFPTTLYMNKPTEEKEALEKQYKKEIAEYEATHQEQEA